MEALKNLIETNLSLTVTSIIALIALLSPICVAIINNVHHTKIKKMELKNQMEQKQFEIYYSDKVKAFTNLTSYAGKLITEIKDGNSYANIFINFHNALLLCNSKNQMLIVDFVTFVNTQLMSSQKPTKDWEAEYLSKLSALSISLNNELCSTADNIRNLQDTKQQ